MRRIEVRAGRIADSIPVTRTAILSLSAEYQPHSISKAVVLKPFISPYERGVVFVSFEDQWARLLNLPDLGQFASRYQLVVAPTWSPPHCLINYLFPRAYPGKIVTLISSPLDLGYLPRISANYLPVELYASNWVDPDRFHPLPRNERDIDVLMVANFGKFKRHFALFRALQRIQEPLRVVLVGQPNGDRTASSVMSEAAAYGLAGRIELRECLSNDEVITLMSRAKTCVVLSKREGSCVVVVESMFADTPVGMLQDASIGSKVFVNEHTGRLLRSRALAEDLRGLVREYDRFTPRMWAMTNGIDCRGSSERLNSFLRNLALSNGEHWTQNICAHHWRPDPQILDATERHSMAQEARGIESRFNIQIG